MAHIQDRIASTVPTIEFIENFVDADGFRIRYVEAGQGRPVVWLHGAGGLHLKNGHHLLAATHRVVGIEMPGFGDSAPSPSWRADLNSKWRPGRARNR